MALLENSGRRLFALEKYLFEVIDIQLLWFALRELKIDLA
jgi:hypothetical protein